MLTLGIDSSAAAASAAIVEDGKLLGEYYVNTKQTHSQTLLPMVQGLKMWGAPAVNWMRWLFPTAPALLLACASVSLV